MKINSAKLTINRDNHAVCLLILIFFILAIYLIDNLLLGPVIVGIAGNHILPIFLWSLFGVFAYNLPAVKYTGKIRFKKLMRWLAFICILVTMLISLAQGGIFSFGRSPYDRSLIGITINVITLSSVLIATAITRSWLVNRFFSKAEVVGVFIVALFFTVVEIPLISITTLSNIRGVVEFFATTFVPLLGENILATYFAFLGGPIPAFIYQFGIMLFERVTPILPNSPWVINALFSSLSPIIGLILIREVYQYETRQVKITREKEGMFGWLAMAFTFILFIWFALGVFTIYPRVILSGSMEPDISMGDVVLINRDAEADLGDVVSFEMGEVEVVHRIIEVKNIEGQRNFVTQGDASDSPDDGTVIAENINGKVTGVVPKIGWITLLLRGQ
ncbi:MAG: signal peptidase I [Clostridiales bacterium]|nr:signal peptidase I [Clostridiales bacterium]